MYNTYFQLINPLLKYFLLNTNILPAKVLGINYSFISHLSKGSQLPSANYCNDPKIVLNTFYVGLRYYSRYYSRKSLVELI